VRTRGRSISGRCFATDGQRLILPAFGALTGGLDVTGDVLSALFPKRLEILLTRPNRVHRFPRSTLVQTAYAA
jgi:metallophosphoesterase superfamily enzyme